MDRNETRGLERLAQIDDAMLLDRRHVEAMRVLVDRSRARGWVDDERRAQELLDMSVDRLGKLELERAGLLLAMRPG